MQGLKGTNLFISSAALLQISLLLFCSSSSSSSRSSSAMSNDDSAPQADAAAVHIIYTEKPESEDQAEAFHLKTLASVLGSEDAAKGALLYSYKHAASGFSAKLTPQQVEEMSKQPGVLQVVPSQTMQLHSGPRNMNV